MRTALTVLALDLLGSCMRCAKPPSEAQLTDLRPQVQIAHGSREPMDAKQGLEMRAGDTLISDESGQATVLFASGALLTLGPSSSIVIEAGESGLRGRQVRLLFGDIEASGRQSALIVMTRLGRITFDEKSNQVHVQSSDQGLSVKTLIGEVRLGDRTVVAGVHFKLDKNGIVLGENPLDAGASTDAGADLGLTEAIVIRLRSGRGVYRQRAGTGRFTPLRKSQVLEAGDVVEARRGEAIIDLGDQGEARLRRRARLQVSSNSRDLELKRGQGRVVLKGGQRQTLAVAGTSTQIIAGELGAEVRVQRNRQGGRVQVMRGSAQITDSQGSQMDLLPGEEARVNRRGHATRHDIDDAAIKINPRLRRVYVAQARQAMTFTWPAGSQAGPFIFEIAHDPAFAQILRSSPTRTAHLTVDDLDFGIYSWRVRGALGPLVQARFAILRDHDTVDRGARSNTVRASAERTVILYQQWKHPELTFAWPPRDGATQYRVAIYVDGAFETPEREQTVDTAQLRVAAGSLKDGRYVWAYTSLDASGKRLATSDMYDLDVKFDSNNTVLRILAPHNGQRAPGGALTARGMVSPGTSVSVNGKKVGTDARGRFEAKVRVRRRSPVVLFQVGANLFVRRVRP